MGTYIIAGILIVVVALCVRSSVKHFRGESSCCGGSTSKTPRKKLGTVVCKKTIPVEGMSCQNCVNRVMEAVNSIDGASAAVHLKKGIVVVSMEHPIDDAVIENAIEKAGYHVTKANV